MIEISLMIEGQNGLNWHRWQQIARAAEDFGFDGLYRSDHYTNANPPDLDSLELWVSLTWLATNTKRIKFGPLVTPVSFRHPTMTARMAAAVDDLSDGRLVLGLGAGWQEREHTNYGLELLPIRERFIRFEEGIQIISHMLRSVQPLEFRGKYFNTRDAVLLPRPYRSGGPPILIGGNGTNRTIPLAARYADEWNAVYVTVEEFSKLNAQLTKQLENEGKHSNQCRRSLMTGCVYGENKKQVEEKVQARTAGRRTTKELRDRGLIVGSSDEIVGQIMIWENMGLNQIMLQWLDLDDIIGLEGIATNVLPNFKNNFN